MATHLPNQKRPRKKIQGAESSGIQLYVSDHGKAMLLSICEMFRGNQFCDVTLDVGGRRFQCHKAVLGAVSSYFKSMFTNGMAESKQDIIMLKDVNPDVFSELLNFIYTGKFVQDGDNYEFEDLVRGAIFFDIHCLQNACISYMAFELADYTASEWFQFRRLYNDIGWQGEQDFPRVLIEFAVDFFQALYREPDFVHLDVDTLIQLVSSDELLVKRESMVFDAVKIWLAGNRDASSDDVNTLLEQVRYPLMKAAYVYNVVEKFCNEGNFPRLRELVNEAKMCHLLPEKMPELVGKSKRGTRRTPASLDERAEREEKSYGFASCLKEECGSGSYFYSGYGQEILSVYLSGLLEEDILCDFQVHVQKEHFRCHKVVLAAFSTYFKQQISLATMKSPRSKACPSITVKDIDPHTFRMLLDYAYSGRIQISKDSIRKIAQAGRKLDSQSIRKACCCFLEEEANAENCLDIIMIYQDLDYVDYAVKPIEFASKHFENIITQPQFCCLDGRSLEKIVSNGSLIIQKEEVLFVAVKFWYQYHSAGTPTPEFTLNFEKICDNIRFPLMSAAYLCTEVQVFCENVKSRVLWDLLEEAKLCHLMPEKKNELIGKVYYSHRVTPRHNYVGFTNYPGCHMHQLEASFSFSLQNPSKLSDTFQESPVCEIGNYFWSLKVRVEGVSTNSPNLAAYVLIRPKLPGQTCQKEIQHTCMTTITVELMNHKNKANNTVKQLPKQRRKANTPHGWSRFIGLKVALDPKAGYRSEFSDELTFKVGVVLNLNPKLQHRKVLPGMDLDSDSDSD